MWLRPEPKSQLLEQAEADANAIRVDARMVSLPSGLDVRVFAAGKGQALMFAPMLAELNFVYAPQLEEFSKTHQVILHEPLLSRSHPVTIADRARELVAVMDALELVGAHLIAWSDAGSAAYLVARDWPDRCRSVTFLGLADRYRFPLPLRAGLALLRGYPLEYIIPSWLLARVLAEYLSGQQVSARWIRQRTTTIPELTKLFKHSVLPNLVEHEPCAGEVTVPALVICGDADHLVKPAQAKRMAALLPRCDGAIILSGAEHFLPYVNAGAVNACIREFLDRVDG